MIIMMMTMIIMMMMKMMIMEWELLNTLKRKYKIKKIVIKKINNSKGLMKKIMQIIIILIKFLMKIQWMKKKKEKNYINNKFNKNMKLNWIFKNNMTF